MLIEAIVLTVVILSSSIWHEKYLWNNGICRQTGQPWQYVGYTESGNLYKSDKYLIAISYQEPRGAFPKYIKRRFRWRG